MLKKLMKLFNKRSDYFVSDAEKFLCQFDKTHSGKSDSQIKEINKYDHVFYLRDHAKNVSDKNKLWEGF